MLLLTQKINIFSCTNPFRTGLYFVELQTKKLRCRLYN